VVHEATKVRRSQGRMIIKAAMRQGRVISRNLVYLSPWFLHVHGVKTLLIAWFIG
jgi:hypothetical protein